MLVSSAGPDTSTSRRRTSRDAAQHGRRAASRRCRIRKTRGPPSPWLTDDHGRRADVVGSTRSSAHGPRVLVSKGTRPRVSSQIADLPPKAPARHSAYARDWAVTFVRRLFRRDLASVASSPRTRRLRRPWREEGVRDLLGARIMERRFHQTSRGQRARAGAGPECRGSLTMLSSAAFQRRSASGFNPGGRSNPRCVTARRPILSSNT